MAPTKRVRTKSPKPVKRDPQLGKAVAQSPFGQLLGFARGYATAILAFLVTVIALDQVISVALVPSWPSRGWRVVLISIGVALPAFWLYFIGKPRARPSLFVQTELAKPGYFRIGPYEDNYKDRPTFDRADGEHKRVLDWLLRQAGTPLYLTGDSGTGKSSLLQAFVLPALRKSGWTVKAVRTLGDPELALRRALEATEDAANTHALLVSAVEHAKRSLLIVLDQFEEFVILEGDSPTTAVERFRTLLVELQRRPVPGLRLLIVLRSDYQTHLERLGFPVLRQDENWRQVGRFGMADSRAFFAASGLSLTEPSLVRLLASAADLDDTPGLIRPITLNILGFILAAGRAVWREHDTAYALIREYVHNTIHHPVIRDYGPRLLRALVTTMGTKHARSLTALADAARLDLTQARTVLLNLQAAGLVRALGETQEMWEVSHDFVARLLERELEAPRRDWWPRFQRRYDTAEARQSAEAQARSALADLGIFVRETQRGLELSIAVDYWSIDLQRAKPFIAMLAPRLTHANLKRLNPYDHGPVNLEPLSALTELQVLDLGFTTVADLRPLCSLIALQSLDLSQSGIIDIAPLSGMTKLRTLNLAFNEVTDLQPLRSLTALETIDLSGSMVADLAPLSSLVTLKRLHLSARPLADLTPLSGLAELQWLEFSFTKVIDLAPLSALTSLQSLHFGNTEVVNLTPLSNLTALEELTFWGTKVVDLAPLSNLLALKTMEFQKTAVSDLTPLCELRALQRLDMSSTAISDLAPLSGLTALRWLNVSGTAIADLTPIRDLTALRSIDLSETKVKELTPLHDLPLLQAIKAPQVSSEEMERLRRTCMERGIHLEVASL